MAFSCFFPSFGFIALFRHEVDTRDMVRIPNGQ